MDAREALRIHAEAAVEDFTDVVHGFGIVLGRFRFEFLHGGLVVLLVEEGYAFGNAGRGGKRHGRGEGREKRGLTNTLEHSFSPNGVGSLRDAGSKNTASMIAESLAAHS